MDNHLRSFSIGLMEANVLYEWQDTGYIILQKYYNNLTSNTMMQRYRKNV